MSDLIDTDVECTLPYVYQPVLEALGIPRFGTDPCTNAHATVPAVRRYMLPTNGLESEWWSDVWCNPPYSDPRPWLKRCAEHSACAVALVKGDYSTRIWAEEIWPKADLVLLYYKRLKFFQPSKPERATTAKWANALILWNLPRTFNPAPLAAMGKLIGKHGQAIEE